MALSTSTPPDNAMLSDDAFVAPTLPGLVIYQLTLDPGMSPGLRAEMLDNIVALGATAIELLPAPQPAEPREHYVPAHVAVERAFGGASALRSLVAEAHRRGLAVIVNIAYRRPDPVRADVALDITQDSVRRVIVREALRWLRDTHVDGVRHDMDAYTDLVDASSLPRTFGWQLIREMNQAIRDEYSNIVLIALDDRGDARLTSMDQSGGLFHTQWDMQFVHAIREGLEGRRPMADVRDAIGSSFGDTFSRIIYTHCADLIGREPTAAEPLDWESAKRVSLGVAMTLTSPGIPLLFEGQ